MATSRYLGSTSVTSRSPMKMRPEVTDSRPATMRSAVVLPQPEGPSRTRNSPSAMSRSRPFTTSTAPKDFRMFSRDTFMRSAFHGADEEAAGDVLLQHAGDDDDGRDHHTDEDGHVPPLRPAGGVLRRHEHRHGLGVGVGEEERQ